MALDPLVPELKGTEAIALARSRRRGSAAVPSVKRE